MGYDKLQGKLKDEYFNDKIEKGIDNVKSKYKKTKNC